MKTLRYIFFIILLTTATIVYSQSWDMFFNKGKEHYDKGNYEKAIKNFELYLKYESDNPKAEVKQLLEQAKKRLAEKADTPTNVEQVAPADIIQLTEKPSPKVTEQPTQAEQPHEEYFIETALGLNMKMIYVEGGTFMMGAPDDDMDAADNEKPQHKVTLDSYYIAEFEVTQYQWEKVMGTNIYQQQDKANEPTIMGVGNDFPMYYINTEEAKKFCKKLTKLTGKRYNLPTEAQWEFAARGGNKSKGFTYSGSNNVDEVAWYEDDRPTNIQHPVGQKQANELGLYDMSGNVWERCLDEYGSYSLKNQTNPVGTLGDDYNDELVVVRGGGFDGPAYCCRITYRGLTPPSFRFDRHGFRVVCIPD